MAKVTSRHLPPDHPIFSEGPTTFVPWSPKSTKTSATGTDGEQQPQASGDLMRPAIDAVEKAGMDLATELFKKTPPK